MARYGSQASDYAFKLAVINQVVSTDSAYWDLVYAKLNLENKRVAQALAQQQLKEDKLRVQVGTLAPLGLLQDEAAAAQDTDVLAFHGCGEVSSSGGGGREGLRAAMVPRRSLRVRASPPKRLR